MAGVSTVQSAPRFVLPSEDEVFALACAPMKCRYAHSLRVYSSRPSRRPEELRPCRRASSRRGTPVAASATAVSGMEWCSDLVGRYEAADSGDLPSDTVPACQVPADVDETGSYRRCRER